MVSETVGYEDIVVRHDAASGLVVVELDRPERRNAMSPAMVASLLALLRGDIAREAGAIVIHGAGTGFCAGSDLSHLAAMSPGQRSEFEADCGLLSRLMTAFPRPILCAVHGFAIGGGLTLAAAADIVVTTPDARWSLPEVPIGLFPAWGLAPVARRTGAPRARQLSWGIDTLDGQTAQSWGLVDRTDESPLNLALALAGKLAALPHDQVAAVKDYFAVDRDGEEADRHANRLFLTAGLSAEGQASFARFGKR